MGILSSTMGIVILAILGVIVLLWLLGIRIIPNDKAGIVEKWWR